MSLDYVTLTWHENTAIVSNYVTFLWMEICFFVSTFCKEHKTHRKNLNPIIQNMFILPFASLGLSSNVLIWQGPSVLCCWTCSDLVKKCCLKQRWDRGMDQNAPEKFGCIMGLRAQLVICFSSEELVRRHPRDCWDLILVKKGGLLYIVLWSSGGFYAHQQNKHLDLLKLPQLWDFY